MDRSRVVVKLPPLEGAALSAPQLPRAPHPPPAATARRPPIKRVRAPGLVFAAGNPHGGAMTAEHTARALLGRAERRTFHLPERGVTLAALDWGGRGPLALLHHANGFCKGVWALVADALRERGHVIAFDARGHGDSSRPEGADAYAWDE